MSALIPDRDRSLELLRDTQQRFSALLRAVQDPKRTAIGKWDTGTVATHVSHVFRMYPSIAYGTPSPIADHLKLSEWWDKMLAEDRERDPSRAAERIQGYTDEFFDAITRAEWTGPVSWYGGLKLPAYVLPSLLMNECEIHGLDIAGAENRAWQIPREQAVVILLGTLPLLPHFLNHDVARDVNATWQLKLRGGPPAFVSVRDGKLSVAERAPGPIDCTISADPATYLLVGYGRRSQWPALLKGQVLAYGRKPWLGLKFARLFHSV